MVSKLCRLAVIASAAVCCALAARPALAWQGFAAVMSAEAGVAPTGACCQIDGVCVDNVTQLNCSQISAAWGGAGSTCISNICGPTGGCCLNGICDFGESKRYCEQARFGRWYPTCGDPQCNPTAGCCVGSNCITVTENQCFLNGGQFLFFGCEPGVCNGACCLPNGGGCIDTSEANCNTLEGSFEGVGTVCNGFQCPGACCDPAGGCQELTPYDCFISGGSTVGGLCKSANCVAATGACCLISGVCQDGTDFGLCVEFNGAWGGFNSTCAQINCQDAGSCCIEFSPGNFFCQRNIFDVDCVNQGGTFNGPGTTCTPNPCGVVTPTGACCFATSCQLLSAAACANASGLYKGDNTACSAALCCPADFNNDGSVNTPDLTYFLGRFGGTFNPPGSERADLNADGSVNTADLTRFLGAFGRACPY
ncbi:MAG: GC-type dockerin domain-anchored protein [Phycisphaerales bacterium]